MLSSAIYAENPADSSQTKKADSDVPKNEKLSQYGNPVKYKVKGKTYNVLRTARGYIQEGIASWYGSKFHKKRTSSGEPYDMYALTAAHKTLPLPTYVRVKNLENGREITVRVNDRGPFYSNRIIDLSYAAAKKLGMTIKGTARVQVEAIVSKEQKKVPDEAQYYIQVAAYNMPDIAERLQNRLESLITHPVQVAKKAKYFVVLVGPLLDTKVITAVKEDLKRHGFEDTISTLR